jgi:hypothetical protein
LAVLFRGHAATSVKEKEGVDEINETVAYQPTKAAKQTAVVPLE